MPVSVAGFPRSPHSPARDALPAQQSPEPAGTPATITDLDTSAPSWNHSPLRGLARARLQGETRDGGAAVRVLRRRSGLVRCLVVPAPVPATIPAVPVPVSAVMLVATPVVAVVVVVSVMVVAVSAGDAAGEDLRYLHAVSSPGGWDGLVCPMGVSLRVTARFHPVAER